MRQISAAFISICIFFCGAQFSFAQNDSLNQLIRNASHDSVRARLCNQFSGKLGNSDVASGIYYANEALKYSRATHLKKAEALALVNLGYSIFYKGDGDSAIALYNSAIVLARSVGDSNVVAMAFNRIGFALHEKGKMVESLQSYNAALKSNIGEKNLSEAGFAYVNIGLLYHDKKDYENALINEQKGLELYRKANDRLREANAITRIGNVYLSKTDSATAMKYYDQALKLAEEVGFLRLQGVVLNNMAMIEEGWDHHGLAISYYRRALAIREKVGDKNGVALLWNNLGGIYEAAKQYDSALFYLLKSLDVSLELDYKDMQEFNYFSLSTTYEKLGETAKALHYFKLYHAVHDSIYSDNNRKELNELNTRFETTMREKKIEQLTAEGELKAEALDAEKKQNYFMIGAIVLLFLFIGVVWRSAVRRKRANILLEQQKTEIAAQKKIVEEQHHDILDSITYAQRIQRAVLPTDDDRSRLFPNSFVFYRPRDIVSGDFWWMSEVGGMKLIAVGDCTGHGVPGAFMSLIGNTLLNEIVNEKKITDPGIILTQLNAAIGVALKQKESEIQGDFSINSSVKDGMDIAICVIDEKLGLLFFAGANNPIVYTSGDQITEIKGDRQPIGFFEADKKPFTVHTIPLSSIGMFYLFSDGYADQFGGAQGKKFKHSRLKEELHRISRSRIDQQQKQLENVFDEWRGSIEQIDDVCVLGVQLSS